MPFRVACLFLALVVFWSALATQEQTYSAVPSNIEQVAAASMGQMSLPSHDGSIEDHHLDDQPAQVQFESSGTDLYGLMPARRGMLPIGVTVAWLERYVETHWLTPYLDGLQRPPRATELIA